MRALAEVSDGSRYCSYADSRCSALTFAPQVGSAKLVAMDERALKRLLIIVVASIIAIFLFKAMMSNTIVNLNRAAAEKKQAAVNKPAGKQEASSASDEGVDESSAASAVGEDAIMLEPSPVY